MAPINAIPGIGIDESQTLRWYVIYTKPSAEEIAKDELEQKCIEVVLFRTLEHHYSLKGKEIRTKPLFPNYLFVRMVFPDDYYTVIWTKGVRRIVGIGSEPIPLDDSIVEFLIEQADRQGIILELNRLHPREKVRVNKGPLKGLLGVVDGSLDRKGRVKVLMDFLKEGVRIEMPRSFAERQWN